MAANHPFWPRRWLMTDERLGERLWDAVDKLPTGGGIIFRHYSLPPPARLELGLRLADQAKARQLVLGVAGSVDLADRLGAALIHNRDAPGTFPHSLAIHDDEDAEAARTGGAALAFIAPVFATRSHPHRAALGIVRAVELASLAGCHAIALGGMNEERFAVLSDSGFHGYAGIDCWLRT